jgi:hypothetical protein
VNIVADLQPEHLAYWRDYEYRVAIFTGPSEQAVGIEPAVGVVTQPREPADLGVACVRVAWKPNEIDLAHLARGGTIWLSTWGGLPPHSIEVQPPPDPRGVRQ